MMHAIFGAVFVSTSAICFGLAFILLRKTRIGTGRFSEPVATLLALLWTVLAAFALVELSKFGLAWKVEFAELGSGVLLGLLVICLAAFGATGWLVRRSH
jgi:hypothetical protein